MIFDILLVPDIANRGERILQFQWNEETGEFAGLDAAAAREIADGSIARGYADRHPWGCTQKLGPDPYRTRADLAGIFAMYYTLPSVWADALPAPIIDNEGDEPGGIEPLN